MCMCILCIQAEELAKSKLEKPKRLQQQAHREWQEIKHGSLKFQRRQQEAQALRQLTKPELVAFFQVLLRAKRNVFVTVACLQTLFWPRSLW